MSQPGEFSSNFTWKAFLSRPDSGSRMIHSGELSEYPTMIPVQLGFCVLPLRRAFGICM